MTFTIAMVLLLYSCTQCGSVDKFALKHDLLTSEVRLHEISRSRAQLQS